MKTFLILLSLALPVQAQSLIHIDPRQQQALGIRTQAIEPVDLAWGEGFPARVRVPNAQLMVVSAPQKGLLSALLVAEGEAVEPDQVLAIIQSPKLVEQQRLYLEALTRLQLARAELQRDRKLQTEGIIAERRLLETQARFTQARTEVDQRRQSLLLAGMDERALKRLKNRQSLSATLKVRAPMKGVVLEQMATPGQRLDIASPLYRIAHLDPVWVEIQVPLEKLKGIQPGTAVQVQGASQTGKVVTIGSMIQEQDQSVQVRAEVPNPDGALRPGQFVETRLARPGDKHHWRVPREALLRANGQTWVMALRDGGYLPVPVEIDSEEADALIIQGDLKASDQIVISGTAALKAAWQEEE